MEGRREDELIGVVGGQDRAALIEGFHLLAHIGLEWGEVDDYGASELGLPAALHVEGRGGEVLFRGFAHPPPVYLYHTSKHHHIPYLYTPNPNHSPKLSPTTSVSSNGVTYCHMKDHPFP